VARRTWAIVLLTVAAVATLAGCGGVSTTLPLVRAELPPAPVSPPTTAVVAAATAERPAPDLWPVVDRNLAVPGPPYWVAEVRVPKIGVYESPTAPEPLKTISGKTEHGFPRVLLGVAPQGDKWEVLLPLRPNGSVGWVRTADVDMQEISYWVRVDTATHTLTAGNGAELLTREPVAVGTGGTPTPQGTFYLTELIKPLGQPYYGPFAYTLSAHSDVLHAFMGGDGTVGIHGTNAPGSIGRAVSHGCIRLSNPAISMLARTLPLGTPVFVT
jgi:lipoprotein-anchoring transpeptidase ErfK/SrfK